MNSTRDVFQAIADPTRRQIIHMLATKPLNVNTIAEQFDISRQAVSLHVQYLNDCGLISIQQQGRERYCKANLDKLDAVTDWVMESKKIWMQQFRSLEKFLEEKSKSKRINKANNKSHGK
jgi:DNA-binding transcriptional ArsR family regulator